MMKAIDYVVLKLEEEGIEHQVFYDENRINAVLETVVGKFTVEFFFGKNDYTFPHINVKIFDIPDGKFWAANEGVCKINEQLPNGHLYIEGKSVWYTCLIPLFTEEYMGDLCLYLMQNKIKTTIYGARAALIEATSDRDCGDLSEIIQFLQYVQKRRKERGE